MSTELIINASLPETRIALMENGEIQDLLIERASGKGIVGNIYKGRVTRVLPGMQAAFVDIGLEKAAFLYVDDVFVHSEIWEAEESEAEPAPGGETPASSEGAAAAAETPAEGAAPQAAVEAAPAVVDDDAEAAQWEGEVGAEEEGDELSDEEDDHGVDEDDEDDGDDQGPVGMCPPPGEGEGEGGGRPEGTVGPGGGGGQSEGGGSDSGEGMGLGRAAQDGSGAGGRGNARRRHRRGRRGGRFRRRDREEGGEASQGGAQQGGERGAEGSSSDDLPQPYLGHVAEAGGSDESDRGALTEQSQAGSQATGEGQIGRPDMQATEGGNPAQGDRNQNGGRRPEFREQRDRGRRIKAKQGSKPPRAQANIQDLLKEGQEVIVQVAKDPISTKGARLTCHISLPGRHLVCMPTIDHVGVSRRIERDDERRKLREYVERYRPRGLGFIVRTASGRQQSEKRIKQDIEYLTRLWAEIREKAAEVTAPALVYEDLNSVLRAIRDWVTEDIDKIVVDSRYHFNDIQRFASHFMPSLKQKVELYHGDVPIFDAYNISTELARGLERKVWLKSGGYLVVDQAEALVAIDVNTGRFVGKKNLEDTILKTNLEAVQEIAYQLRLRNCGGIIILDLIDMEREENKQRVYRALEEALKKDRARPSILKISELGLVEMTRKRTRDTMVRALCEACPQCEGKGFTKSKQTVAYEILRELERVGIERDLSKVLVQAHPEVIDILAIEERDTLDQLERRYRKQVFLQAVPDYHVERFEVSGDKREKGERGVEAQSDQRRGRDGHGDRDRDRDRDRGRRGRGRDRDRGRDRGTPQVRPVDGSAVAAETSSHSNGAGSIADAGAPGETVVMPRTPGSGEDFYSEEDRLAFLRAQAAQDAALARLGGAPAGQQPQGQRNHAGVSGGEVGLGRAPAEGGRDSRDADRRRGRRGRRGGKHRRGREFQNRGGDGGGEGQSRAPMDGAPAGGGSSEGGTGTPSGTPSGGGGDSSNPPTHG